MNTFNQYLTRFLIVSLCYFNLPIQSAHAELVPTYALTATDEAGSARQKLERYLQREDVRAGLELHGVNADAAKARVDALADDEVAAIAGKIDTLPAGGNEIIGVLLFVFVLLLLTDILGLTKVFDFTRSAKK